MNKRQREMLIGICEKVAVYALTVGLLGRFLTQVVSNEALFWVGGTSVIATLVGFQIAKGVRS